MDWSLFFISCDDIFLEDYQSFFMFFDDILKIILNIYVIVIDVSMFKQIF